MSLSGIEVLIEKLSPKILVRLAKENPLKDDTKMLLYSANALWHRQLRYVFCVLCTISQGNVSVCMQVSRECCLVRSYLAKFLRQSGTLHFSRPFRNLPGSEHRRKWYTKEKNFSGVTLSSLIFWWEYCTASVIIPFESGAIVFSTCRSIAFKKKKKKKYDHGNHTITSEVKLF